MSNIDKIRQEIERRKELLTPHKGQGVILCREIIKQFDSLLSFLDTLPDEPVTDCGNLEEEIKEQIYDRFYDLNGIAVIGTSGYAEVKDMEDIARHFAEWQKRKMMEGAVEGKVFMSFAPGHNQMVMADVDLPTNTKVKIIIVKEDEIWESLESLP